VVRRALPYVGGGMVLTAAGVMGGLSMIGTPIFQPLFIVAIIANLVLFFVSQNVALKGNNGTALPLLATYSLITGFTLSGLVAMAIGTAGIGSVATAALATGITFVGLGIVGLLIAMVIQLVGSIFVPGFGGNGFELLIAGFGTVLFVGAAFVDFYTMPRSYRDDQYLAGALGMYLTYINLFVFILRLIIALQGGGRRE
jgi:FtsH-binding integral membrane protein